MRINERLAKLQVDQLGLVTYEQARAAGVGYAALDRRRADGSLTLVSPGVLGGTNVAASFKRCVLAEVLSAGATAFASHETAAALWGLMPEPTTIEVTTVLERRPRRGGARMHRSGLLIDTDVAFLGAIPVSAPERTVVDLSSRLTELELGRVIDEALRLRFTTLGRIYNTLERLPRAPGRSPMKLRNVLARRTPGAEASESVLEDFISEAIRRFELPSPVAQHRVVVNGRRRRIDLAYVARKVALEAKGFEYHSGRARFDDDALRSNELRLAGLDGVGVHLGLHRSADRAARRPCRRPPRAGVELAAHVRGMDAPTLTVWTASGRKRPRAVQTGIRRPGVQLASGEERACAWLNPRPSRG